MASRNAAPSPAGTTAPGLAPDDNFGVGAGVGGDDRRARRHRLERRQPEAFVARRRHEKRHPAIPGRMSSTSPTKRMRSSSPAARIRRWRSSAKSRCSPVTRPVTTACPCGMVRQKVDHRPTKRSVPFWWRIRPVQPTDRTLLATGALVAGRTERRRVDAVHDDVVGNFEIGARSPARRHDAVHARDHPARERLVVALRCRGEEESDRHPQDVAEQDAGKHLDVSARMPDAVRPLAGRRQSPQAANSADAAVPPPARARRRRSGRRAACAGTSCSTVM